MTADQLLEWMLANLWPLFAGAAIIDLVTLAGFLAWRYLKG